MIRLLFSILTFVGIGILSIVNAGQELRPLANVHANNMLIYTDKIPVRKLSDRKVVLNICNSNKADSLLNITCLGKCKSDLISGNRELLKSYTSHVYPIVKKGLYYKIFKNFTGEDNGYQISKNEDEYVLQKKVDYKLEEGLYSELLFPKKYILSRFNSFIVTPSGENKNIQLPFAIIDKNEESISYNIDYSAIPLNSQFSEIFIGFRASDDVMTNDDTFVEFKNYKTFEAVTYLDTFPNYDGTYTSTYKLNSLSKPQNCELEVDSSRGGKFLNAEIIHIGKGVLPKWQSEYWTLYTSLGISNPYYLDKNSILSAGYLHNINLSTDGGGNCKKISTSEYIKRIGAHYRNIVNKHTKVFHSVNDHNSNIISCDFNIKLYKRYVLNVSKLNFKPDFVFLVRDSNQGINIVDEVKKNIYLGNVNGSNHLEKYSILFVTREKLTTGRLGQINVLESPTFKNRNQQFDTPIPFEYEKHITNRDIKASTNKKKLVFLFNPVVNDATVKIENSQSNGVIQFPFVSYSCVGDESNFVSIDSFFSCGTSLKSIIFPLTTKTTDNENMLEFFISGNLYLSFRDALNTYLNISNNDRCITANLSANSEQIKISNNCDDALSGDYDKLIRGNTKLYSMLGRDETNTTNTHTSLSRSLTLGQLCAILVAQLLNVVIFIKVFLSKLIDFDDINIRICSSIGKLFFYRNISIFNTLILLSIMPALFGYLCDSRYYSFIVAFNLIYLLYQLASSKKFNPSIGVLITLVIFMLSDILLTIFNVSKYDVLISTLEFVCVIVLFCATLSSSKDIKNENKL